MTSSEFRVDVKLTHSLEGRWRGQQADLVSLKFLFTACLELWQSSVMPSCWLPSCRTRGID